MPTITQHCRKFKKKQNARIPKSNTLSRSSKLIGNPQRKGICKRVTIMKPKKPNSAKRKIARVNFLSKKKPGRLVAYIAGIGHNLRDYSEVLIRGGHVPDLPGIQYHLIRGKFDFEGLQNVYRSRRRSLYGIKREYLKVKEEMKIKKKRMGFVVNEAYFLTLTNSQILEKFKLFNDGFIEDLESMYTLFYIYKQKVFYERQQRKNIVRIAKEIKDKTESLERIFKVLVMIYAELFLISRLIDNINLKILDIKEFKKKSLFNVVRNKYSIQKKTDYIFMELIFEKIILNLGIMAGKIILKEAIVKERAKAQGNLNIIRRKIEKIIRTIRAEKEAIKKKEKEEKQKKREEAKLKKKQDAAA